MFGSSHARQWWKGIFPFECIALVVQGGGALGLLLRVKRDRSRRSYVPLDVRFTPKAT